MNHMTKDNYQIISRKFRPKRFNEVAGHEAIVTTLKNAIAGKRLGQAYLFCGARGCGKTTLARLFAKALNCIQPSDDYEPCNTCIHCQEISEGRSLDIIEIDGASNRGIDDIRQINETVGYAPNNGPYKIYIIDEVHMLTKEAFNALLKTLEEPPQNVKFFFATTEPHKIPQTILSRCQRFNLSRIPQMALVEKLTHICKELKIDAEKEALLQISHLSEGSLRDAESLLDQLICFGKSPITLDLTREVFGLLKTDQLFALDEAIHTQNQEMALELAKQFYESGRDIGACIDSLLEHFREVLLIHLGNPAEDKEWAKRYSKQQCLTLLDTLIEWQQQMLKTPFKQIHLEMLLINLVRKSQHIPLDQLITRLLKLEEEMQDKAGPIEESSSKSVPPVPPTEKTAPNPASDEPVREEEFPLPASDLKEENANLSASLPITETKTPLKKDVHPSQHDTLIRFAAVELEGSVKQGG
ncbi:MAG: DNA polymerase III subunit tau [Chlamydiae bacterium]|nr:DNA polymerase III subunit tau [Chlamydiota bacterium]